MKAKLQQQVTEFTVDHGRAYREFDGGEPPIRGVYIRLPDVLFALDLACGHIKWELSTSAFPCAEGLRGALFIKCRRSKANPDGEFSVPCIWSPRFARADPLAAVPATRPTDEI